MQSWFSDLIAEYAPQCIVQADCFSGTWSPVALETNFWNQQWMVPVAPDCTSILQFADVAVIAAAKRAGEAKKQELLLLLLEEVARRESTPYQAKMGKYEVFEVAVAMAKHQSELQKSRDVIMGVAVATQMLALRPGKDGSLVRVADTPLSQKFPAEPISRGLCAGWVARRFAAVDKRGVPAMPDWSCMTNAVQDECLPSQPEEDDVIMTVADEALVEARPDMQSYTPVAKVTFGSRPEVMSRPEVTLELRRSY